MENAESARVCQLSKSFVMWIEHERIGDQKRVTHVAKWLKFDSIQLKNEREKNLFSVHDRIECAIAAAAAACVEHNIMPLLLSHIKLNINGACRRNTQYVELHFYASRQRNPYERMDFFSASFSHFDEENEHKLNEEEMKNAVDRM